LAICVNDRKSPRFAAAATLQMTRARMSGDICMRPLARDSSTRVAGDRAIAENRPVRVDAGSHPSKHSRE
jgi:hypothetical protein